ISVGSFGGIPTGVIDIYDNGRQLGTTNLVWYGGSYTTASLTAGAHTITAVYRGDATHAVSSGLLTQIINAPANNSLAWGNKVSPAFADRVRQIGANLGVDPNSLMAIMAFETGETFSPSIRNAAGSGAT